MIEISRYSDCPIEGLTIERANGPSTRKIRGVASVYYNGTEGTEYKLGKNIVERIAPGAWDHLVNSDCMLCFDHDAKTIVSRTPHTLRLWTTQRGLEYEGDLGTTTAANDLWDNVSRGLLKGSSFRAGYNPGDRSQVEWSVDKATGKDVCLIKRFSNLIDVSAVTTPAYKATDTQAIQRSLEEWKLSEETKRINEYIKNLKY